LVVLSLKITLQNIKINNYDVLDIRISIYLSDAPGPQTKDELIDYSNLEPVLPLRLLENLQRWRKKEGEIYESIEEIWPDYPNRRKDYLWKRGRVLKYYGITTNKSHMRPFFFYVFDIEIFYFQKIALHVAN